MNDSTQDRVEQPALDPDTVKDGTSVRRRPAGRCCTIWRVAEDRSKVLVNDNGHRFWVQMDNLVRDWY